MTETGYVGENVENLLGALLSDVKYPELGWEGLLVVDGLHHLAARTNPTTMRDVSGAEVQRDLIRVLDGRRCEVQPAQRLRHPQAGYQSFPCDRLLVVCSATLELPGDLDDASLRRSLRDAGLLDELLSRFDVIVPTARLTVGELTQVCERLATRSRGLFEALGGTFEVVADGARVLAEAAARSDDGAFALHRPLARLVQQALLEDRRELRLDAAIASSLVATAS
jgi:hypothetical protein